jgi:hypothetical protein
MVKQRLKIKFGFVEFFLLVRVRLGVDSRPGRTRGPGGESRLAIIRMTSELPKPEAYKARSPDLSSIRHAVRLGEFPRPSLNFKLNLKFSPAGPAGPAGFNLYWYRDHHGRLPVQILVTHAGKPKSSDS